MRKVAFVISHAGRTDTYVGMGIVNGQYAVCVCLCVCLLVYLSDNSTASTVSLTHGLSIAAVLLRLYEKNMQVKRSIQICYTAHAGCMLHLG